MYRFHKIQEGNREVIGIVISQFDEQIQYVKCHMKEKQDFAHVIMKHVPELIVDRRRVYETTERRIRGDVYMANKSYFRDGTLLFRKGMKDVYAVCEEIQEGNEQPTAVANEAFPINSAIQNWTNVAVDFCERVKHPGLYSNTFINRMHTFFELRCSIADEFARCIKDNKRSNVNFVMRNVDDWLAAMLLVRIEEGRDNRSIIKVETRDTNRHKFLAEPRYLSVWDATRCDVTLKAAELYLLRGLFGDACFCYPDVPMHFHSEQHGPLPQGSRYRCVLKEGGVDFLYNAIRKTLTVKSKGLYHEFDRDMEIFHEIAPPASKKIASVATLEGKIWLEDGKEPWLIVAVREANAKNQGRKGGRLEKVKIAWVIDPEHDNLKEDSKRIWVDAFNEDAFEMYGCKAVALEDIESENVYSLDWYNVSYTEVRLTEERQGAKRRRTANRRVDEAKQNAAKQFAQQDNHEDIGLMQELREAVARELRKGEAADIPDAVSKALDYSEYTVSKVLYTLRVGGLLRDGSVVPFEETKKKSVVFPQLVDLVVNCIYERA